MINRFIEKYYITTILGYAFLFAAIYSILYFVGIIKILPGSESLLHWDAGFYNSIKNDGYMYNKGQPSNVGFFPLFPYFWKIIPLNPIWISILNGVIYLASLSFLASLLKPDKIILGFFMASPFMFFMFTPLSEPLFFLFITILLYGIIHSNSKYIFIGALLASVTRASFLFLIPALVGMSLMSNSVNKFLDGRNWKKILLIYILPCVIGLFVTVVVQYVQTGKWFAYFEVQSEVWERKFKLPTFPLGLNAEPWIVRASVFSFWIGMFASLIGIKYLVDWFVNKPVTKYLKNYELLAIIFLSMSLLSIVFFNPTWYWVTPENYNGTYIIGINRYIHPIPFFLIFLIYLYRGSNTSPLIFITLFVFSHLIWLIVQPHSYDSIAIYWKSSIVLLMLLPYWIYYYFRWKALGYGIIFFSFILQCMMYGYFLSNVQVD